MDTTVEVGTDVANFWLYDPTLLQHRMDDPRSWYWDFQGDPWVPEYCDGRIIACSGLDSDGTYLFRCTTGALTRDEAHASRAGMMTHGSLLRIVSGSVHLDGGYVVPCTEVREASNDDYLNYLERQCFVSLSLASGLYSVYVHYLLHLEPVEGDEDAADEAEESEESQGQAEDGLPDIVITFRLVS